MRGAISPLDHAFADGPVFKKVSTLKESYEALKSYETVGTDTDLFAAKLLAIWKRFEAGAKIHDDLQLGFHARLINGGDKHLIDISGPTAIRGILRAEAGGIINVGKFVYIGDNAIISSRKSIAIGDASLIAHGVQIFDNDSHPTQAYQREIQFRRMLGDKSRATPLEIGQAAVDIGRRCWIGLNSVVLKGVTIGDSTIVAAHSVVTNNLPANVVAGGNPARVLRELPQDELKDL